MVLEDLGNLSGYLKKHILHLIFNGLVCLQFLILFRLSIYLTVDDQNSRYMKNYLV